jgi:DNA polymerase (family X)
MASKLASNTEIAEILEQIGDLLESRGDNPFRVKSYRRAASLVKDSDRSFARLAQEQGVMGLTKVRGIGERLAGVIEEYVSTNKVGLLEELQKEAPQPEGTDPASAKAPLRRPVKEPKETKVGRSVPSPGMQRGAAAAPRGSENPPSASVILDVDAEYRKKAEEGSLKVIAPKQHNPEGAAWLPILSTSRGDWKFTAMFSNTALAHQLGRTDDWVVIYFKKKGEVERQCTVVTEHTGELKGKRVIRGREEESRKVYR